MKILRKRRLSAFSNKKMSNKEVVSTSTPRSYYGVCFMGGLLSSAATNVAITPLDVLKVNMQVHPIKYGTISTCFTSLWKQQGPSAFYRAWGVKLYGNGIQGACRFGLYECFKNVCLSVLPPDQNKNTVYFISSAASEIIANFALCPFEAVKVRVQAHQEVFAKGLSDCLPKMYASEGLLGFYRGLIPLLGRNLPFSVVMFSTFEYSVDFLYTNMIKKNKNDCSTTQQLGVTCLAAYAAGSLGTVVSNPADNVLSSLYNKKANSLKQAVKRIGIMNLFTRSLPVRIMLVGPSITLQWFFYDTFKVLNGLPTSGHVSTELTDTAQILAKSTTNQPYMFT